MIVVFHTPFVSIFRLWHIWALIASKIIIDNWNKNPIFIQVSFIYNIKDTTETNKIISLRKCILPSKLRNHVQVARVSCVFLVIINPESYIIWRVDHFIEHIRLVGKRWPIISLRFDKAILFVPVYIFKFLISWIWWFETFLCMSKMFQNNTTWLVECSIHPTMSSCLNRNRKWMVVHFY